MKKLNDKSVNEILCFLVNSNRIPNWNRNLGYKLKSYTEGLAHLVSNQTQ